LANLLDGGGLMVSDLLVFWVPEQTATTLRPTRRGQ
jgi:hypothetical protein